MGSRAFIAALVGAGIGMCQFLYVVYLDADGRGTLPRGDFAYFVFSLTWLAELFALIVIAMYRFSPWLARLMRDEWEATRILRDKRRHVAALEWAATLAIVLRAGLRALDSGQVTTAVVVGSVFAAVPLLVPRPPSRKPA